MEVLKLRAVDVTKVSEFFCYAANKELVEVTSNILAPLCSHIIHQVSETFY